MSEYTANMSYGDDSTRYDQSSPRSSARSSPYNSARQRPSRPSTGTDSEHRYMGGESLSDDVRAHLNMDLTSRNLNRNKTDTESDEKYIRTLGDLTFYTFSGFTQRILPHPCLVFRSQCQLNSRSDISYALLPWSMIKPIHNMYKNQGAAALYKGVQNDFVISLIRKVVEVLLSENTTLPLATDVPANKGNIVSIYIKHLLLKTISTLVTVPFVCAGHMLRVKSQIVSADSTYFAIFTEAYRRFLSSFYIHNSETNHMLPLYKLVLPITALSLGHYITHQVCYSAVQRQYQANTLQLQYTEHDEIPAIKKIYDRYFPQLLGALSGNMIADIMCYPLSTIVGRLILQGTRTIIDDTETGNGVLSVTSQYTGSVDCLRSILNEEGFTGLYKGFGAMLMQYLIQGLILHGAHSLYARIMEIHYPRVPKRGIYTSTAPSSTYSSVSSLNNTKA